MIASAKKSRRPWGDCKPGDVLLLENVRYYNEEEANDPAFAEKLAKVADVYVNDAFGAAHRAHASTEGVARIVAKRGGKCAAGLLMERELKFLGDELENPARPFVVILGGAKVSDKIKVIDRLLEKADTILIGGAMAYTFRAGAGLQDRQIAGGSRTRRTWRKSALEKAKARNVQFLLPTDNIVATPVKTDKLNKKGKPVIELQNPRTNSDTNIPDDAEGLDIGPATRKAYCAEIAARAKTILWNGPMGIVRGHAFCRGHECRGAGGGGRDAKERRQEHHRRRRQRESVEQSRSLATR